MEATIRLFLAFAIDLLLRILFDFGAWTPDLLLISLIYFTMTRPLGEAYFWSFTFGVLWDAVFVDIDGMHAFLFIVTAMVVARLRSLIWGQYAISRFFLGFVFCALMRFGEVMIWLSNHGFEVSVEMPQSYIVNGALVTGLVFMAIPWRMKLVPLFTGRSAAQPSMKWLHE